MSATLTQPDLQSILSDPASVDPPAKILTEDEFLPRLDDIQAWEVWTRYQRCLSAEEQGFTTTDRERLEAAGIRVPSPETVSEAELHTVLWDVLEGLARFHVYVLSTDHLSDRELYQELWKKYLHQPVPSLPPDKASLSLIDLAWSNGPDDADVFLAYYADLDIRNEWKKDHPGETIPRRRRRRYERDIQLPQPAPMEGYLHVMARFPE